MRNKHILLPLLATLLAGLTSCDEWLDIKPENKIILEDFWQTESHVESVLMACYRGLTEDDVVYRMIVWGELRSDNMVAGNSTSYDINQILNGNIISSNSFCSWSKFYTIINYCNTILYYAPEVLERDANFTRNDLNRVTAEALAIRSLCYFYLVRTFRDVPWEVEASIKDDQEYQLPKSPENVVLGHIVDDLLEARRWAVNDFGTRVKNKGFMTKSAVNALLADVYLWMGRYNDCIAACDEVLADTKLKLVDGKSFFSQVFYLGNSTESIFELQFDQRVQQNQPVYSLYGVSNDPNGEVGFPMPLAYDAIEKVRGEHSPFNKKVATVTESVDDIRCTEFIRPYGGSFYIFKYAGIRRELSTTGIPNYRYRSTTPNWIVYRLPDVMLMKAEALVQLGGETNFRSALELVNTTYLRSNLTADSLRLETYPTKTELVDLVLRERQRELLFEGKRWFDLVRLAKREDAVSVLNTYVEHKAGGASTAILGAPVMDAMYMPIAKGELENNPNLVQNPYYEQTNSSSKR